MGDVKPTVVTVAPNGSYKSKEEHPHVPLSVAEIVREAERCQRAGATVMHLHVRDNKGGHSLNVSTYRKVMKGIRKHVSDSLLLQVTTESAGVYTLDQQIDVIKTLKPEAVSVAWREFFFDEAAQELSLSLLEWMAEQRIVPQFIFYNTTEWKKFLDLKAEGLIPGKKHAVLFVLGSRKSNITAKPAMLTPYLSMLDTDALKAEIMWTVCAFGKRELDCMIAAMLLGGHVRIGFENNVYLREGVLAQNNEELVEQFTTMAKRLDRPVANITEATKLMLVK